MLSQQLDVVSIFVNTEHFFSLSEIQLVHQTDVLLSVFLDFPLVLSSVACLSDSLWLWFGSSCIPGTSILMYVTNTYFSLLSGTVPSFWTLLQISYSSFITISLPFLVISPVNSRSLVLILHCSLHFFH
jgi:hypothetical protein